MPKGRQPEHLEGKAGKKTPPAELTQRITRVAELLANGLNGPQIFHFVTEKQNPAWNITERTLWNYIREANQVFEEVAKEIGKKELGKAMYRLNALYANCMKIQDFKGALAVQREINELLGLKQAAKVDITTNGQSINPITAIKIYRATLPEHQELEDEYNPPDQLNKPHCGKCLKPGHEPQSDN